MTPLQRWLEANKDNLFVALDEAHHAPAYGCRNLLQSIQSMAENVQMLGLTATPTYEDSTRSGWLFMIFEQGVLFEADKTKLTAQDILAKPKYIQNPRAVNGLWMTVSTSD